ncbi:MAG: lytic transglycosylase domain-containing protein [Nitrospinae bacterium]|nr:lytic transglycosylase domain-containing protein [Nitrospinota bacterium]MBI3814015.1 lytic transglycosylase domain-containing protein [Nitrospinota bacterium]
MAQLIFAILITFVLGLTERCYADLYMYVDEKGSIFFTDAPTHGGYVKIKETPKTEDRSQKSEVSDIKPTTDKTRLSKDILYKNIQYTAKRHNVDPDLIWAVIRTESNFNSAAVSPKGAKGLMQLMPATARAYDIRDPFNPHQNVEGGTRYLRYLLSMFNGDLTLSLAAYNAGENTVLSYGNIPPFSETRDYVSKVLSFYRYLKGSKSDGKQSSGGSLIP